MLLSPKQIEFVQLGERRWNFKGGATRSGKTYLDFKWIIPMRIRERKGLDGLVVIMGVTKSTIERNVLEPMRNIYGSSLVGRISSDNTVKLFGEQCYALGAEKVSQVSKLRGSSIKYCYGDEVAEWSDEVFELLKSRLDKECSCFDGTYNPKYPTHWLKKFLDSDADIYSQCYTIDDNPFLPAKFVEDLKKEYFGTVFYDRYIKGLWAVAEGAVYPMFADNPAPYLIDDPLDWCRENNTRFAAIMVGVDFGGNESATKFQATGITHDWRVVACEERRIKEYITPDQLNSRYTEFVNLVSAKYGASQTRCDNTETILIRGLFHTAQSKGLRTQVKNAIKMEINSRIHLECLLFGTKRLFISRNCPHLIDAFQTARWSDKGVDERLDDGSSDIDSLDAFEYTIEPHYKQLERAVHMA
jgi:Phage terminase large subunit